MQHYTGPRLGPSDEVPQNHWAMIEGAPPSIEGPAAPAVTNEVVGGSNPNRGLWEQASQATLRPQPIDGSNVEWEAYQQMHHYGGWRNWSLADNTDSSNASELGQSSTSGTPSDNVSEGDRPPGPPKKPKTVQQKQNGSSIDPLRPYSDVRASVPNQDVMLPSRPSNAPHWVVTYGNGNGSGQAYGTWNSPSTFGPPLDVYRMKDSPYPGMPRFPHWPEDNAANQVL
ncbi:hypothetical protein ANO11243_032720 [Dothideomycetidae sp. 11243]|nr:hypothetical protein ANO11243_032720 [fungal sp. No.11243]